MTQTRTWGGDTDSGIQMTQLKGLTWWLIDWRTRHVTIHVPHVLCTFLSHDNDTCWKDAKVVRVTSVICHLRLPTTVVFSYYVWGVSDLCSIWCLWKHLFVSSVCSLCLWPLFVASVCVFCLWPLIVASVCGLCCACQSSYVEAPRP